MIFTFYRALGKSVGASMVEEELVPLAAQLMRKAEAKGVKFLLPTDVVVADRFDADAASQIVSVDAIPDGWMGLDIGPASIAEFSEALGQCRTVVWNGPMVRAPPPPHARTHAQPRAAPTLPPHAHAAPVWTRARLRAAAQGVFEFAAFAKGTYSVAEALGAATDGGAITIIGGGDSVAAVEKAGLGPRMSHISTGGGASLELLEGKELPGVAVLSEA